MSSHKPSLCLISWLKATTENNSFYEEALKLAFLWFDDLVMQSPREDVVTRSLPAIFEKLSIPSNVIDQIVQHIHPIQSYFSDYEFARPAVWDQDTYITDSTIEALTKYFEETLGPHVDRRELHREVALTGFGVIDAINLVGRLSSYGESFMLPTDFEHRVLQTMTRPADPRSTFTLFEEVARYRLPRLKELPWSRVVELRHHRFLENFRRAISTLREELARAQPDAAHEVFVEIERKNVRELLSLLTPSVLTATAKSIITNLPLPIPVNPAGLADAIWNVWKERQIAERFGWIYFLYELDN